MSDFNPLSAVLEEVFPMEQILNVLRLFKTLRRIHFGKLPFNDRDNYMNLFRRAHKLGLVVEGQIIVSMGNDEEIRLDENGTWWKRKRS